MRAVREGGGRYLGRQCALVAHSISADQLDVLFVPNGQSGALRPTPLLILN